MFPNWEGLPSKFKYVFGGEEGTSYTGAWRIPATLANVEICRALTSKVDRYQRNDYPYKDRIVHPYYPDLVIMTASIQGLDSFAQNTDNPYTDSTSGSPVLQNVGTYEATFEWRLRPRNPYGLKHAYIRNSFEGSFQELPNSVVEAHPIGVQPAPGSALRKALPTGVPVIAREKSFQVIYDFVPEADYDEVHLQEIQGRVSWDETIFGTPPADQIGTVYGCVLYVNSEKEDVVDSLGEYGYRVTHNFILKPRNWNYVDVTPPSGATTRGDAVAIMVIKGLPADRDGRPYLYHDMKPDRKLFYYGWES